MMDPSQMEHALPLLDQGRPDLYVLVVLVFGGLGALAWLAKAQRAFFRDLLEEMIKRDSAYLSRLEDVAKGLASMHLEIAELRHNLPRHHDSHHSDT